MTEVFAGNVPEALANQAITAAKAVAQELNYVGVLCVEFFVLADNSLVVNEIAPRPHNTAATTAKTPAMCRSLNCKCAPWLICL